LNSCSAERLANHRAAFELICGDLFAVALNSIRNYVVSTTLQSPSAWRMLIGDNVVDAREDNLIDEYSLHVYPIVLGGGKRLIRGWAQCNHPRHAVREGANARTGIG
jgi:hypothetical protein